MEKQEEGLDTFIAHKCTGASKAKDNALLRLHGNKMLTIKKASFFHMINDIQAFVCKNILDVYAEETKERQETLVHKSIVYLTTLEPLHTNGHKVEHWLKVWIVLCNHRNTHIENITATN